jgi:hypothetical protein
MVLQTFLWVLQAGAVYSLPFKGRVRVGMGYAVHRPIPLPTSASKGEENTARVARIGQSSDPHKSRMNP